MGHHQRVESHYGRGRILPVILNYLAATGKDLEHLTPSDLIPVEFFHLRGRQSTLELAIRVDPKPGVTVLDVGCGIGGPARHLASEHGCIVTGIDLTGEFVDAAAELSRRTSLTQTTSFVQGSGTDLPFASGVFDLVWTEHAQMNVADKTAFYGEAARVCKPGGRLAFHDIFQGPGGAPLYPVPWAEDDSISHLASTEAVHAMLLNLGLEIVHCENVSSAALDSLGQTLDRAGVGEEPPLIRMFLGDNWREKIGNLRRNFSEQRIIAVQAVAEKR